MGTDAETFAADLGFIEGPVWNPETNELSLVSISRGCVFTLNAQGEIIATYATGGGPNGMVLGHDGLLVAQNGGIFGALGPVPPGVQRIHDAMIDYAFADTFDAPNDLAFGPDDFLYVTDPKSERAILEPVLGRVLACDLSTGTTRVVVADRPCPNGLAFTADGEHLLLALTQARRVERFRLGENGLVSCGLFCELVNGRPDGMAIDQAGRLWICTPGSGGVEVFSETGDFIERHEIGERSMTTNLCFGGKDGRDLFVTAAGFGQVLKLKADIPGLPLRRGPRTAISGGNIA